MSQAEDFERAKKQIKQRRFRSARETLANALSMYSGVGDQVLFSYQLGALYWSHVGDGEQARNLFQRTLELFEQNPALGTNAKFLQIKANACENLMLLSLSPDEFEEWAEQLEAIQPTNEILHTHRDEDRKLLKGESWPSMMLALAVHYLDADPSRQHSFPFGASILQLLLNRQNTRAFRLDRDEWREAVVAYAGATLGIVGDCGQRMLKISKTPYPEEFTFIIEDAIPLVEDYLDENPSDERVRKSLETLRTAVEQSNLLRPPPVIIHTERDVDPRRVGCVSLLIGVIFSLIAGSWAFFLYRMAGEISGWPATVISVLAILSSFFLIGGFRLRFGDQTRYDRWTKH